MKAFHLILLITSSILFVSCSNYLSPPSPSLAFSKSRASESSPQARVLIKTGTMRLQVNDVQQTSTQAKALIKNHKGYVERIDSSDDNDVYTNLQVRVPKKNLIPVMNELAALGKVTSRNVQVEDVTEQWIDLQAKISNLRALRDRLRKLLHQAKNVKETLEIEKELTRVQSELDSLEGKTKAMKNHVTYSKLTIRIRQKSIPGPIGAVGKGAWWGIKKLFVLK